MEDRIVLITGGAPGIGRGIAACFARRGYRVAIADMNAEATQEAAAQLQSERAPAQG